MCAVIIALTPVRGWLIDTVDRDNEMHDAPLIWLFDAIKNVGSSAVPVQMIILGEAVFRGLPSCSSAKPTPALTEQAPSSVSAATVVCVVVSKMLLMPLFGIATVKVCTTVALFSLCCLPCTKMPRLSFSPGFQQRRRKGLTPPCTSW